MLLVVVEGMVTVVAADTEEDRFCTTEADGGFDAAGKTCSISLSESISPQ